MQKVETQRLLRVREEVEGDTFVRREAKLSYDCQETN